LEKHTSQLLKGLLDMCLLSIISRKPMYGYEMIEALQSNGLTIVSEGSIYPVLTRLQNEKLVTSFTMSSPTGPNRKYYQITSLGSNTLDEWKKNWKSCSTAVDKILEE